MALDQQAARVYQIRTMFLPRMLKWDDRNSMAFSVEARYPFLDPELIQLALSFAPETLYRSGWTKLPLRLGLAKELPDKVPVLPLDRGGQEVVGNMVVTMVLTLVSQWVLLFPIAYVLSKHTALGVQRIW